MIQKYRASLVNGETVVDGIEDPRKAIEAVQRKVEQMRRDGISQQIEATIHVILEGDTPEIHHFIYRPNSIERLAVKPHAAASTNPVFPESREEGLSDLLRVGREKPLGFLNFEDIQRYTTPETLQEELRARGLVVKIFPVPSMPSIKFMFVYDETALQKLLDQNVKVLEDAGYPKTAGEFVDEVAGDKRADAFTKMYTLISTALGDFTNPGRIENVIGPDK